MLHLANTLTGQKEEFRPLNPPKVTLYVCGVTVYDDCHVGHARGAVVFDVLKRFLESQYRYSVTYVRNITDVDDKIIDRARAEVSQPGGPSDLKATTQGVARRYEQSFRDDFSRLELLPPTHEPRATEFIPKIVEYIKLLLKQGVAYEASDGVYFCIRKVSRYGQLSHQKLDQMLEGTRIEPGEAKLDPLDFALWKKAKPAEPSWESPWGPGRPGWHIECSTMSTALLGDAFDIHGGGQDLIFPHHENELAQALGAGKPFAKMWLHNGLLTVNGQKMSKSLGNVVSIREVLERHGAPVLRLFYLSAHYRSPLDFTWERLDEAARAYERLYDFLAQVDQRVGTAEGAASELSQAAVAKFIEALEDDLNTPQALSALYGLVAKAIPWLNGEPQAQGSDQRLQNVGLNLRQCAALLGISFPQGMPPEVRKLIDKREEARRKGDFRTADEIRRQLGESGYIMEDTGGGTVVRKRV